MPLTIILNGRSRSFAELPSSATLEALVGELGLQGDRIAIEHNGEIVSRTQWKQVMLAEGDKLEVVHFVGGGTRDDSSVLPKRIQYT